MKRMLGLTAVVALALTAGFGARAGGEGHEAPIALQLYTVRAQGPLDEQLALAARAGYTAVETVGTHGLSAQALRDRLAQYGLEVVSSHVDLGPLRDNLDGVIDYQRSLGNDAVVLSWLPHGERPDDAEGWRALGRELDAIGARLREAGLRFAYHNHDFEMAVVDGQTGLDHLLGAAEAENLAWQADVAWIDRGGQDPAALLRRHAGRVASIHAKDNAPPGEHVEQRGFADVGHGSLDWRAILPAALDAGAAWFIVEHDLPADAEATLRRSRTFLLEALPAARDDAQRP